MSRVSRDIQVPLRGRACDGEEHGLSWNQVRIERERLTHVLVHVEGLHISEGQVSILIVLN